MGWQAGTPGPALVDGGGREGRRQQKWRQRAASPGSLAAQTPSAALRRSTHWKSICVGLNSRLNQSQSSE